MNRFLSITFLFTISVFAKSQTKPNGFYIDSNGKKIESKFLHKHNKIFLQYQVCVKDSNDILHTFIPDNIKGFTFQIGSVNRTYETVLFRGNKIFLQLLAGAKTVKEYAFYYHYTKRNLEELLVYKNDTLVEPEKNEKHNTYLSRVFSDYPLLSAMAYKKLFDELYSSESNVIFEEYDKWVSDTLKRNIADTSFALKGILDANQNYKPNKYFWYSFLVNRLLTPFIGMPLMSKTYRTKPINSDINIQQKNLSNKEYIEAYEARAFTKKRKAIAKGVVFSFIP